MAELREDPKAASEVWVHLWDGHGLKRRLVGWRKQLRATNMLPCCHLSRSLVPPQAGRVRVQVIVLALNNFRAGGTAGNVDY